MIRKLNLKSLLPFFFVFVSTSLIAQTGNVRGFVYDSKTGEPVIFATVYLVGTTHGASTDIDGFFSIAKVPEGTYRISATFIGYDSSSASVKIRKQRTESVKIFLNEKEIKLKGVDISAEKEEARTEVKVSTTTIKPKQINMLPSVGGEADLAQYLQVLPGVVSTGDQGGQIYIRGGTPIQTLFLLDGMPIYNPFHSIGLFSVFETDLMSNVDVYTGGFNSEFGNRISAVVDVSTRDGNKKRIAGKLSANPFVAKAIVEGPLKKLDDEGGSSSFLVSAKGSYLDRTSPLLYSYAQDGGLPYSFFDTYAKMSFNSKNGSKFSLFGFNNRDKATFLETSQFDWKSYGAGARFIIIPGNSNIYMTTRFNFTNYEVNLVEEDGKPRFSRINGFNAGMEFTYFIKDGDLKYGVEVTGYRTEFEFRNVFDLIIDQNQNTTNLGAYFKARKATEYVVIEPSIRFEYYGSLGVFSPEPRLGLKINATDNLRFKFATGLYSQNLISTKSDKDIVNLFTGFLSGPEEQLRNGAGETANNNLQRGFHLVGGVEYDLTGKLSLNVEPYYKNFFQLININRNKLFPSDGNYLTEKGLAYGTDLTLKYNDKRWFLWATYSLAYVERDDGVNQYNPHFDRRHNINLVGSRTFGAKDQYEISARWNFGTGFPFTKTQGFYEVDYLNDGITSDYTTNNGDLSILYDEQINGGRLPDYSRLDISAKRNFFIGQNAKMQVVASVTNVYNRSNIFYFDRVSFDRVDQLPILPSLGVSFTY